MFSVYQLTDALTASLFGMFALWAAASHRHWFVRTVVVGAALLIMLLIPAYEPLIEFTVEILLVVCGIAVWRRRHANGGVGLRESNESSELARAPFRLSLETLLLLMAVVAVVTAVAARAPHISVFEWYEYIYSGAGAALIVLISTWAVCGQTRWWVRLIALPAVVYLAALTMRWLVISRWMLQYWFTTPSNVPQYWQNILTEGLFSGASYWAGSIGLGTVILCIWLFVVRQAGWFDPFRDSQRSELQHRRSPHWQFVARGSACVLFALVSSYSVWLLYLLMTPTPIPDLASTRPNEYYDLLKAGRMIGETDSKGGWPLWRMTKGQLSEEVSKHTAALSLAHAASRGECHFPLVRPWDDANLPVGDDRRALYGLLNGLWAREMLASKTAATEDDLATMLDLLHLAFAEDRSHGVDQYQQYAIFVYDEFSVVNYLWFRRTKLNAEQCTDTARELWALEYNRVSWEKRLENERIIAENSGFESHLRAILDRWAGINRNDYVRQIYLQTRTRMRILIVALALHAFEQENGRLPKTLDELRPKYLAVIPEDPFDTTQPLHYRAPGAEYLLYSVGLNKADDTQGEAANSPNRPSDDLTETTEFPPSRDPDAAPTSSDGAPAESK